MAERVKVDEFLSLNGVDLSDRLQGSDYADTIERQDASRMGTTSRIELPGLIGKSFNAVMLQDYAAGKTDATISPLAVARTQFPWRWRSDKTAAISATNPEHQATVAIATYTRAAGRVGETDIATVELMFCSVVVIDIIP